MDPNESDAAPTGNDILPSPEVPEINEADELVLRDLESRYANVRCPVHDVPPKFEVDAKGAVVETICCEALLQIFRELQASEQGATEP